jgi:thiol-disulfide isomerase/thioredoxin
LPLTAHIADPAARGAALEAFTKKYANCEPNCMFVGRAYLSGLRSYGEAGDLDGAKRVADEWVAWDPKNPDPPAALAQTYLTANKRLPEALELTNRAAELYQPFANTVTRSSSDRSIRSEVFLVVAPFAISKGRIELLRGKIEAAMGDWPAAGKDLQVGSDALANDSNRVAQAIEAAFALGSADEHTGAKDAALTAYLSAASEPYQKDSGPHDAYVRLFVEMAKGTAQQAEDSLLAAVREHRSTNATAYVPVELHQAMPKLEMTNFSGKAVPQGRPGRTTVVDIWATWCSACALELPSLLEFQKTHPGVDVLAVDVGDKPDAVRQFLTSKHLTGLHVALTKEFPKGFAQNYPTTFVVSPKHEIAFLHTSMPSDIAAELGADIASLNP